MDKYEQLRMFDDKAYEAMVTPRVDEWEVFLKDTRNATFLHMPAKQEITLRLKKGRKTRKK